MRQHPDHHDAELLLRLYELRREEKLRQAREWVVRELHVESFEEFRRQFPPGSRENAFFRMTVSYWEMAASMVNEGLIKEEFFFENTSELWFVWQKIKHMVPGVRKLYHNPLYWKNLEAVGEKYEKWMNQRAPEALGAMRKLIMEAPAKK